MYFGMGVMQAWISPIIILGKKYYSSSSGEISFYIKVIIA